MSESFDPYRVWLAIPPESRPPTHYELLGVSPQENDPAVINAAMLRQSGYVRNFQIGKYAHDAARVLNEIAAAKACLLDPAKRAKYDAQLRPRRTAAGRARHQAAAPLRPAIDLDQLAASAALSAAAPLGRPTGATRRFVTPRNKRKPSAFPWRVTVAVAATVAGVGIGFDMLRPRGEMAPDEPAAAANRATDPVHSDGAPGAAGDPGPAEPPVKKLPPSGEPATGANRATDAAQSGGRPGTIPGASRSEPSGKNHSPSVEIVSAEPPDPKAGGSLTIRLAGHDTEDDAIAFEYRKGADGAWQIAPDGLVSLAQLDAGPLSVQVRARDGNGALSEIVTRAWEIESAVPPAAIAPFSAEQAHRHQEAWATHLGRPIVETNAIGMKLVLIPPGEFQMGSPPSEAGRQQNEVQHMVRIAEPFYLGVYEVTQKEYHGVMGKNPSAFSLRGFGNHLVRGLDTNRFPVESVSWDDALEFCRRLSASLAEQSAGRAYRLPTEAEWEYACRAGTTTPFHFGDELNGNAANCDGQQPYGTSVKGPSLGRTESVGSHAPNPFGMRDMHGNVLEWCADGAETGNAQHRGGFWGDRASLCRSAHRRVCVPTLRVYNLGFRVAVDDASYKARDLDGREISAYRCGKKTVAPSHAKFRISGDDDGNFCFNGLIDNVAFFNRALSNTEIEMICRGTFISHRPRGQSDE